MLSIMQGGACYPPPCIQLGFYISYILGETLYDNSISFNESLYKIKCIIPKISINTVLPYKFI